jgi:glycosyltransferase involved in cell wall biosynthesis
LIRAAGLCVDRFREQGRRIQFQIAGGGDAQPLRAAITEAKVDDYFEILGPRSDIPFLMAQSDLIVNSSRFEGLPLALIEAAMAGLPAVATDVGGNSEIVKDGMSGFLVPPGRADLLADAIVAILSDGDEYRRFSVNARAAAEGFSLARCSEKHLELYGAIASGR